MTLKTFGAQIRPLGAFDVARSAIYGRWKRAPIAGGWRRCGALEALPGSDAKKLDNNNEDTRCCETKAIKSDKVSG